MTARHFICEMHAYFDGYAFAFTSRAARMTDTVHSFRGREVKVKNIPFTLYVARYALMMTINSSNRNG